MDLIKNLRGFIFRIAPVTLTENLLIQPTTVYGQQILDHGSDDHRPSGLINQLMMPNPSYKK